MRCVVMAQMVSPGIGSRQPVFRRCARPAPANTPTGVANTLPAPANTPAGGRQWGVLAIPGSVLAVAGGELAVPAVGSPPAGGVR